MLHRVIRDNEAIVAIKEEIPIYELLGVSVEEGLRRIKDYLWNTLFKGFECHEGFERLWEERLRPLAEKALKDTYKIFYYLDLKEPFFASNDANLLMREPSGELEVTYISIPLEYSSFFTITNALNIITASRLRRKEYILGEYFIAYARAMLVSIIARYGQRALQAFEKLYRGINVYPIVLALSSRIEDVAKHGCLHKRKGCERSWDDEIYMRAELPRLIFCFACRKDTLNRWYQNIKKEGREAYFLDVDRFKEILKAIGYKLEVVDVLDKRLGLLSSIIRGVREERQALIVARDGEGVCMVIVELDDSDIVELRTYTLPCTILDKVIDVARSGLKVWLQSDSFLPPDQPYWNIRDFLILYSSGLSEFTDKDRERIAYEFIRMRMEGRDVGRVDLGRWDVFLLKGRYVRPVLRTMMIIVDKMTNEIYVVPLAFTGTLQDARRWMEENMGSVLELLEHIASMMDAPPELQKIARTPLYKVLYQL